jgi:hypothetical protein
MTHRAALQTRSASRAAGSISGGMPFTAWDSFLGSFLMSESKLAMGCAYYSTKSITATSIVLSVEGFIPVVSVSNRAAYRIPDAAEPEVSAIRQSFLSRNSLVPNVGDDDGVVKEKTIC